MLGTNLLKHFRVKTGLSNTVNAFVRFLVTGGVVFIIDFLSFFLIFNIQNDLYILAVVVGRCSGLVSGIFLHRKFTFPGKFQKSLKVQGLQYLLLAFINVIISVCVVYISHEIFSVNEIISRLIADVIIVIISFVGGKVFVFRHIE